LKDIYHVHFTIDYCLWNGVFDLPFFNWWYAPGPLLDHKSAASLTCVWVRVRSHMRACVTILIFSPLLFDVSYTCNIVGSAQLGFLVILLLKLGRCPFIFTRYPIFTMLIFNSFWDIYCHCTLVEYRQLFKMICFTFSKTLCCFLYVVELIHWVNDNLYCLYTQILPARAINTEQDFNYLSNSFLA
jgi:hypothetical protein